MKSITKLVSICCLLALRTFSQGSPDHFLPDNFVVQFPGMMIPTTTNEFLPAELDTNGHWGEVRDDFQLSIRSTNDVFVLGQPVPVAVILRNTSTNNLKRGNLNNGGEVCFFIEDETGHVRDNSSFVPSTTGSCPIMDLGGRRQARHEYNLRIWFPVPGTFKIHCRQPVFRSIDGHGFTDLTNINSGILSIKIVPK